jgi:aspartate/methionine/tyrosine aminotransferase
MMMPFKVAVNPNIMEMEYAVRGPIPQRAAEMKKAGRAIIPCNIGNPQALGQRPITFVREVLSLLEIPSSIARERSRGDGVSDYVLDIADEILTHLESGVGPYTESKGPLFIREAIARFIDDRDDVQSPGGIHSDPDSIFLTDGASEGARSILEVLIADRNDGIMVPIPQYPLYSASISRSGGTLVGYYPVVINPGNPTGAILDEKSGRDVVEFAGENGLAIIADEVYQENLYGNEWISFAQLIGSDDIPLFSLHSTSKGFYGECGHRGGYFELRNQPEIEGTSMNFIDLLLKQASVSLCSNTMGQVMTYLVVSPPEQGSDPYEKFSVERDGILNDLYDKAVMIRDSFGQMEGVESFGRIGALYLFPRFNKLPEGTGDFEYCMNLLEETGLCTVNGSGFGQQEGTHHLRIAFLPPREMLEEVLPQWIEFHNGYVSG